MHAASDPPHITRLVRRHRAWVVLACVVLFAGGGAWLWDAATSVERAESTAVVDAWSEVASFETYAPMPEEATDLGNGTRVRLPGAAYFTTESPELDAAFAWRLDAPEAQDLAVAATLAVRVDAVASSGRVYWTLERPLDATQTRPDADTVSLAGRLRFDDVATDVAKASERFPPKSGVMRWSLVARVTFSADSAAGRLRNDSLFQLPIDYDAPLFVLPDDAASTFASSHGTTHTVVTETVGGPRAALAKPWALLACALAVGGLGAAWASRREDPALRPGPEGSMWRELARHEEWVTRVQGPVVAPAHPVDVGSLADLVALASEARTRVLFDVSQRVFFVFTQGACYRYRTVMDPGVDERPSWLFGEDAKDTSPVWEDDEEPSSSAPTGG